MSSRSTDTAEPPHPSMENARRRWAFQRCAPCACVLRCIEPWVGSSRHRTKPEASIFGTRCLHARTAAQGGRRVGEAVQGNAPATRIHFIGTMGVASPPSPEGASVPAFAAASVSALRSARVLSVRDGRAT
jgi:hypothetical protein